MEVRRTAPVKLIVPDEHRDDLHESARQFRHCANRAAEFCWDDTDYTNCITANTTARDALYAELREETDLTAKYDSDKSEVSEDTEHQTALGIDLGVNSLAVASTGTFWQGDEYNHWCREFEKRRGAMQQRETQAAHNALLRLGKREKAWRKQYIHTVANEIAEEAVEHDCDVIVFEDVTDIRERLPNAKWHHIWAFRRLYEYVEYKAPERGVTVKQVAPNHTSQRCSRTDCGFTHRDNRDGEHFCCQKCGYEVNADY